jgi:uncharacterized protein YjdB
MGQTIQLTATAKSATGQVLGGRQTTWTTGAPGLATVSSSGLVTGVSPGEPVIFASVEGVVASVMVTVRPIPVAAVVVTPAASDIFVGRTVQLSATTRDMDGNVLTGRPVGWTSSNTAVATVNSSGLVTAVAAGTATITASSEGKSGTATVNVTVGVNTVVVTPSTATISVLGSTTLTATVRDPDGNIIAGAPIVWSTSNALVATVAQDGTVSGLLPGTATITATSGTAAGSATITVQ